MVVEAEEDTVKQYYIGTYLIEGKNKFPLNVDLGVKYFEHSILFGSNIESVIYLSKMLIKGDVISKDLGKAKRYLWTQIKKDNRVFYLYGKILKKESKLKEARKKFEEGSKSNDPKCMYKYAQMLFCGEGGKNDIKEAIHYFNLSKSQGFIKSSLYLAIFSTMKNNKSFAALPFEIQYFFIMQMVRYNMKKTKSEDNDIIFMNTEITLKTKDTEDFYDKKLFNSANFIDFLQFFEQVIIEISYNSKKYSSILDLLKKIKKEANTIINICVYVSGTENITPKFDQDKIFSIVRITSDAQKVENNAFEKSASLSQISFPHSLTSIGSYAFSQCTNLTEVSNFSFVTSIGDYAFSQCSSLTQFIIPSYLTEINDGILYKCQSLTKISIPSSITSIGKQSFGQCSSLEKILIPSSVTSIGNSAFGECSSLKEITIPSSVTSIGFYVFQHCESLKKVVFESSLTSISEGAFLGCSSLEEVSIPSSVTSFGSHSFEGCLSLKQIDIPSSVTSIGNCAFFGCSSLEEISLPSSVTSIGSNSFEGCSLLKKIDIPSSVVSIGSYSFSKCSSLQQISIPESVTVIEKFSFQHCSSLTQVIVGCQSISIEECAFINCTSLK